MQPTEGYGTLGAEMAQPHAGVRVSLLRVSPKLVGPCEVGQTANLSMETTRAYIVDHRLLNL